MRNMCQSPHEITPQEGAQISWKGEQLMKLKRKVEKLDCILMQNTTEKKGKVLEGELEQIQKLETCTGKDILHCAWHIKCSLIITK